MVLGQVPIFSPSQTHSCHVEALNLAHVKNLCLLGLPSTATLVPTAQFGNKTDYPKSTQYVHIW